NRLHYGTPINVTYVTFMWQGVSNVETTRSQYPRNAPRPSCRLCHRAWRGRPDASPPGKGLEDQRSYADLSLRVAGRTVAADPGRLTRARGQAHPTMVPGR